MKFRHSLLGLAVVLALAGCNKPAEDAAPATDAAPAEEAPAAAPADATAADATAPDATAPDSTTAPADATAPDGAAAPADAAATADPAAAPADGATAQVDGCATQIEGNDAMQFNVGSIVIPASCSEFSITLKHTGQMPVAAMGHNVVITTQADMAAVAADGLGAGAAADYVKSGDARVVAHSKLIGGGETTSFTVPLAKLKDGGPYAFFCSFPGHVALMKGTVSVQ